MRKWNHNVILFQGISRFLSAVYRRWFPGQSGDRTCLVLYKRLVICFARPFQLLPSACTDIPLTLSRIFSDKFLFIFNHSLLRELWLHITRTSRFLILGHSFIRRLQKFIEHHIGYLDLSLQITAPADITWHGIGWRTVTKTIKFYLHVVRSKRLDIVIVQLGTNDPAFYSPLQGGSEKTNCFSV